ncbi:MAG: Uma2 family endonuclease [Polyangiaceae bacterium]
MSAASTLVAVHYRVRPVTDAWILPEVPVPESHPHSLLVRYFVALLEAWAARSGVDAIVASNLALRWHEADPRIGIDPDVALITPPPPDMRELSSLCLWKPGHFAPRLAIEVVSEGHPYKDYRDLHEKYAASGVGELWVLDPFGHGPRALGGPVAIQQWVRREPMLERVHFGAGPVFSEAVQAWLWSEPLRITSDAQGKQLWLTGEEYERTAKEAERASKEAERAAKEVERAKREAAEARAAELEQQLAELRARG